MARRLNFMLSILRPFMFARQLPVGLWLFLTMFLSVRPSIAQDQSGLIYGEVITVNEQVVRGVIRWGEAQAFWNDVFHALKTENPYLELLSGDDIHTLRRQTTGTEIDWGFMSLWERRLPERKEHFRCLFGDLLEIRIVDETRLRLTFKDRSTLVVSGKDANLQTLHVTDSEGLRKRVDRDRIASIRFRSTPEAPSSKRIMALYGTVFTPQGAFTGFIQWDEVKGLSTDLLQGKSSAGIVSIPFGRIAEIRKMEQGARVVTQNGRRYELNETDDVSPSNHGIIVKQFELGWVRIPWDQFSFIRFESKPTETGPAYQAFAQPLPIHADVTPIEEAEITGKLIFNLDESLDMEMIDGRQQGIQYRIPLRNIQTIERRNHKVVAISLKNGDKLFLGETAEMSDKNWGLLLAPISAPETWRYLPWNQIEWLNLFTLPQPESK
ncbi:hypothetical protein [Pontibacter sp. G13]|uniref:hypothetical protein n=1 Tax=Pontibacter sp. G13 TaxID=3074898 RepID=UPI00288974D9|nr:hypothetical protein [Pontibacter sp. G13]WNJ17286.1 hypothetical protein RJD25_20745 [Pontibacter sp. G13]